MISMLVNFTFLLRQIKYGDSGMTAFDGVCLVQVEASKPGYEIGSSSHLISSGAQCDSGWFFLNFTFLLFCCLISLAFKCLMTI